MTPTLILNFQGILIFLVKEWPASGAREGQRRGYCAGIHSRYAQIIEDPILLSSLIQEPDW